jgi:hypothetical protein
MIFIPDLAQDLHLQMAIVARRPRTGLSALSAKAGLNH